MIRRRLYVNYISMSRIISFLLLMGIAFSCSTNKKVTYLQEYEEIPESLKKELHVPDFYRVQINDNLYIRIITPDPRWAEMFNTMPSTGGITATEQTVDLISYRVLQDGTIVLPFVGAVYVNGLTLPEITEKLGEELLGYITDADITVKLVNNYVSLLGEFNVPGRYPIYKEHMNIFEAISMAGDLNNYSDRYNIQIIRDTHEGTVVESFDITDKKLLYSEYYYVMPNDVIYAAPMKGKFFRMEAFPFTLILSTATTFISILTLMFSAGIIQ